MPGIFDSQDGKTITVRVFDRIKKGNRVHTYSDRLSITINEIGKEWRVTKIKHLPFEEERHKTKEFLAGVNGNAVTKEQVEMINVKEGFDEILLKRFFEEINKTSMKRNYFSAFKKAYESRSVVLSLWNGETLLGFGTMLTDWAMNSIIYDVVVLEQFQKKGLGKRIMDELMQKAPGTRFYLTSTFGNEDFYRNLGFRKHKTAFALYPSESPYLE